jgi:pyruvate ferredoxin oxidoreductase delta subunit
VHQVKDPVSGDLIFDIDLDYCKGCGICEHECPRHAIKLELEEK